jgi:hypothetical protein
MALPKAVLCLLGEATPDAPEEALLRASGFATAALRWAEVDAIRRGWTQLLPVLDDPAVQAWVFAGHPADFDDALLSQISMLTLGLTREAPPMTAFVLLGSGEEPALPELLGHIRMFYGNTGFAAKLAALRSRPRAPLPLPFHARAHLDPLIGQWLEIGPTEGELWQGFTAGTTGADITAFGVGPRGAVPQKSVLHYPVSGIRGDWDGQEFSACAAKNDIGEDAACYLCLEGRPRVLFLADYLEDNAGFADSRRFHQLDLF